MWGQLQKEGKWKQKLWELCLLFQLFHAIFNRYFQYVTQNKMSDTIHLRVFLACNWPTKWRPMKICRLSLIQNETIHPYTIRLGVRNEWDFCPIFSSSIYYVIIVCKNCPISFICPKQGWQVWALLWLDFSQRLTQWLKKCKGVVLASPFTSHLLNWGQGRHGMGCDWLLNKVNIAAGKHFLLRRYCWFGIFLRLLQKKWLNYCGAERHTKTAIFVMLLPNDHLKIISFVV